MRVSGSKLGMYSSAESLNCGVAYLPVDNSDGPLLREPSIMSRHSQIAGQRRYDCIRPASASRVAHPLKEFFCGRDRHPVRSLNKCGFWLPRTALPSLLVVGAGCSWLWKSFIDVSKFVGLTISPA